MTLRRTLMMIVSLVAFLTVATHVYGDGASAFTAKAEITLTKPVDAQLQFGRAMLPAGTKMRLLGSEAGGLRCDFSKQIIVVPAASTNYEATSVVAPAVAVAAGDAGAAQGLLRTYCIGCHGEKKSKGHVRLDTLSTLDAKVRLELVGKVEEQMHFTEMPPEDEKQPSPAERKLR